MNIECKEIETVPEFIDAIRIRAQVFIIEQGSEPGWEPDENDKVAKQFITLANGKVVGMARIMIKNNKYRIERMATAGDYRKKGIGKKLLTHLINYAHKNGAEIFAKVQVQAQTFYEKCGFVATSKPYDLYRIQHIDMEYKK